MNFSRPSRMSCVIRSPLFETACTSSGLAVLRDPATEQIYELMERQVNQMVRLVDDLLEISRITRGQIELRKERVDWLP